MTYVLDAKGATMKRIALALFAVALAGTAQTQRSVTGRPVVEKSNTVEPIKIVRTFATPEEAKAWGEAHDMGYGFSDPFATTLTCRYSSGMYSYTGHDRVTGQSRVDCSKAVEEWAMTPKGAR